MTDFAFDAPTVIRTKRDGGRLSDAAIDWVVKAYTDGRVADEQMSALLMAIVWRGMDRGEIARWTAAMLASGARLDFTDLPLATVDKHSTGGVGDKITLPLVPVVAACGGAVPQASGRGLGHTGGTLDKLESITGFTANLSNQRVREQLCDVGAAIFAAGQHLQRLGHLERIADGSTQRAVHLRQQGTGGHAMRRAQFDHGVRKFARLHWRPHEGPGTNLDVEHQCTRTLSQLLAHNRTGDQRQRFDGAGNVAQRIQLGIGWRQLAGGGPPDVVELTLRLAGEMLELAGIHGRDPAQTLRDGTAMDRFRRLVAAQGGDLSKPLPIGSHSETVTAGASGTMGDIDAMAVGLAAWRLGAGRSRPGARVQHGAGVRIHRRPGEPVVVGEPLFTLYTNAPERFGAARAELAGGWSIRDSPPQVRPLIVDRIV